MELVSTLQDLITVFAGLDTIWSLTIELVGLQIPVKVPDVVTTAILVINAKPFAHVELDSNLIVTESLAWRSKTSAHQSKLLSMERCDAPALVTQRNSSTELAAPCGVIRATNSMGLPFELAMDLVLGMLKNPFVFHVPVLVCHVLNLGLYFRHLAC